jgi:hypothetical protein
MKTSSAIKYGSFLILSLIIAISLTAFTVNKSEVPGPKDPVKLVYSMTEGKTITYSLITIVNQTMDINGQTMTNIINNDMAFKLKMVGKVEENLKFQITMDSLSMKVESMQGSSGAKIKDVEGKSFNMIISPLGKVIDASEAAGVKYSVEGQGNSDLSQSFSKMFPDLPEKAVNPGDTWTRNDTITTKTETSNTIQILQSVNKYEGIEKINGVECAKISATVTGTMQTNMQNSGMDIFLSGPLQGTLTYYFAVKEGYFVKQESKSKMNGTIEISGPQSMSFPIIMDTTGIIEAKK